MTIATDISLVWMHFPGGVIFQISYLQTHKKDGSCLSPFNHFILFLFAHTGDRERDRKRECMFLKQKKKKKSEIINMFEMGRMKKNAKLC